jgi:Tfp pilus assembly protein PilE
MTIEIFVTIIGILLFVALTSEQNYCKKEKEYIARATEVCRDAAIVHLISMAVALIFVTIK